MPENYADLYKLPSEVIRGMNKHLSMGQRVYLGCAPKYNLFAYDNNVYGIQCYRPMRDTCQVIVRGECRGLRDIETGREYTQCKALPLPGHRGDATSEIPEPPEFAFDVTMFPGRYMFFEVME